MCTQHGVPDGPRYRYLGPRYRNLGPSRPIVGPKRRPRGLPERFWTNFGPLGEALETRKHCKIQGFCCISRSATETSQNAQISPWEVPKRPPRGSQEQPGTPQEAPGAAQDGLRRPQEPPGEPQERPRSLPNSASWRPWRPNGDHLAAQEPSGGLQEPILDLPGDDFRPSRGRFSCHFQPSADMFEAALCAKLVQAYGQHRPTCLCNSYLCV